VAHDRAGTILRLRPDGTTVVVSKGKIKAVSGVAVGRTGVLYADASLDGSFSRP
jgi:hypothetical protein